MTNALISGGCKTLTRLHLLGLLCAACAADAAPGACTVSSSGLAFGAYQPLTFPGKLTSMPVTSDATISIVCTNVSTSGAYTLALGPSGGSAGDRISTRYLVNGSSEMMFNVYTDFNRSIVWGNGTLGSLVGGSIAVGNSSQNVTVYGKLPASQHTLKAGSYSGSMTMTLTYNP
jgi:spore coat protein U-like protein